MPTEGRSGQKLHPSVCFFKKEKRMKQSFGKSLLLLFLSLFGPTMTAAVKVVYQRSDSLKVVRLVAQGRKLKAADRPVYFGRQFLGVPYVAATLEGHDPECLVVNLRQLDCTTLVENVAALTWACQERGDAWKKLYQISGAAALQRRPAQRLCFAVALFYGMDVRQYAA